MLLLNHLFGGIKNKIKLQPMKLENQVFVKSGLLSGIIYALIMAGFSYSTGEPFSIFKFLFLFFFFGLSMGLLARYNHKRAIRKKNANKDATS